LEVVGIYSACYRIGLLMLFFVVAFNNAWSPFALTQGRNQNNLYLFSLILKAFFVVAGFIFLLILPFSLSLYRFKINGISFLGELYTSSVSIIPIIAGAYIFFGLFCIFVIGLELSNKTKPLAFIAAGAALINILGNVILIPLGGRILPNGAVMGAAFSTFISYGFLAFLTLYITQRFFFIKYEWVPVVKTAIILFIMGILGMTAPLKISLFVQIGCIFLYFPLLFALRVVSVSDIKNTIYFFKPLLLSKVSPNPNSSF
jgi:O-antigen/teichoic acid export membrane protein